MRRSNSRTPSSAPKMPRQNVIDQDKLSKMDNSDVIINEEREPILAVEESPHKLNSSPGGLSKNRKILMLTMVSLLVLSITFRFLYGDVANGVPSDPPVSRNPASGSRICTSPECVLAAASILTSIDDSVDPCDDFYQFACGGWIARHDLPEFKSRIGTFDDLSDANSLVLKRILSAEFVPDRNFDIPNDREIDKQLFGKVKNLFSTCMNTTAIDERGIGPLQEIISSLSKEFGLSVGKINDWDRTKISKMAAYTRSLFSMGVSADQKNVDTNVIYIGQGGLGLSSKEYYTEDPSVVMVYTQTIIGMFKLVFPEDKADFGALAQEVVTFETRLASISKPSSELQDPKKTYNPTTVAKLKETSQEIDWDAYLRQQFPKDMFGKEVFNDSTMLVLEVPSFTKDLTGILRNTSESTFWAYFVWHSIRHYGSYLSDVSKAPLLSLKRSLTGQTTEPPRWQTCLALVDRWAGMIASKYFVREAFAGDSKDAAVEAIRYIEQAFSSRLPTYKWMDEATRTYAQVKVDRLNQKIGYPDYLFSPPRLSEKFSDLKVNPTDGFFENAFHGEKFLLIQNLKEILKPVDRKAFDMSPSTVNAYYNPVLNEIVFPAGILQPPFFNAKAPEYLNYGAIGSVVGHELTHAFDNNGRSYDADGKLRDWWTDKTSAEFDKRAQCFVEQYEKYSIKGPDGKDHNVNGKLTLGENLADNGGAARAWDAWNLKIKEKGQNDADFDLPGLSKWSHNQLFWVGFAQVWCGRVRTETAVSRIRNDPHSPPMFRVAGTVENSKNFAEAFKCKPDSPMNPTNKCLLW